MASKAIRSNFFKRKSLEIFPQVFSVIKDVYQNSLKCKQRNVTNIDSILGKTFRSSTMNHVSEIYKLLGSLYNYSRLTSFSVFESALKERGFILLRSESLKKLQICHGPEDAYLNKSLLWSIERSFIRQPHFSKNASRTEKRSCIWSALCTK